ncbi:MAG: SLBB domain-containing protein [Armatimonadota bacterium]
MAYVNSILSKMMLFIFIFSIIFVDSSFCQINKEQSNQISNLDITTLQQLTSSSTETEAESVKRQEEEFYAKALKVNNALESQRKRIFEIRKLPYEPSQLDIEIIDKDLSLIENEATQLSLLTISPILELQRNEIFNKLTDLRLILEHMKKRWGGSWTVYGMDFFQTSVSLSGAEKRPVSDSYQIRIGDTLSIALISNLGERTQTNPVVEKDGTISVSPVGRISVAGKTLGEVKSNLARRISSRFPQLSVEVRIEQTAAVRVQITGEAARPGTYELYGMPTIMTALREAGGPKESGSFRNITLSRTDGTKKTIDLYKFLMHADRSQDIPLREGDLILINPVKNTIVVSGEVVRPARYEVDLPINLGQALKLAGGVKPTGLLQNVQVERVEQNEYRVLLSVPVSGVEAQSSFAIRPGDEITVNSVRPDKTNQVSITGPVSVQGVYGYKTGMTVRDLINSAQGLAADKEVYMGRADILRIDPVKGTEIITFNLEKALQNDKDNNIALSKLDRVFIYTPDQIEFRPRMVSLEGAVSRPGVYKRTPGMKVRDLIAAAGGVLPNAYLDRADLVRYGNGDITELLRIDLQNALTGVPEANIEIKDRDSIKVYSVDEVAWNDRTLRIEGAVQKPGVYKRSENMMLSDIIFAAGGTLPESGNIAEIGRVNSKGESSIIKVNLELLFSNPEFDIELQDRDIITIPTLNSALRSSEVVFITGEVQNPGPYIIKDKNEKLSDIIQRAGGLTDQADLKGLLFLRQKSQFENTHQENDADIILNKSQLFASRQFLVQLGKLGMQIPAEFLKAGGLAEKELAKPADVVADARIEEKTEIKEERTDITKTTPEEKPISAMGEPIKDINDSIEAIFAGRQPYSEITESARISVDLKNAITDYKSADNLTLRDGDRLYIPRISNVVTVIGAVLHPHSFAAAEGNTVEYFIKRSGGYSQDAAKKYTVVIHTNGDAQLASNVKSVVPGDIIVVPNSGLIDIAKSWEKAGSISKVISDILSSVYILTRF